LVAACVALFLFAGASGAGLAQSDDAAATNTPATNAPPPSGSLNTLPPPEPEHPLSLHTDTPAEAPLVTPFAPPDAMFIFPGNLPDDLPTHLLVVYNSSDHDSRDLAAYYAERRGIALDHVLGIACSTNEEISRQDYSRTIREPIISYIYKKGWMTRHSEVIRIGNRNMDVLVATHNDVWAIVLMRGVPLKITNDPTEMSSMEKMPALQMNCAAVDSELALLPIFGLPIGGFVPNPFFDGFTHGTGRAGPDLANKLILVTRLDGPTPADVRRMIDDSIYAEQHRLAGLAVIDSRGLTDVKNSYTLGDIWLRDARDMLVQNGWEVKFDAAEEVIPASDPCNQVAFYLGWYHGGAVGPWVTPPNRFVRGAIAYHLHSYSAVSVRNAAQGWVAPLIAHGADATMGTVYEPYLDLTPHLDIFTRRLLAGNYFAEAAYAAEPGLSWMTTVVGDPLYRPFRESLDDALAETDDHTPHHDWLLLQTVQAEIAGGELVPTVQSLEQELDVAGAVAEEGLGDLLEKLHDPAATPAAETAYLEAAKLDDQPIDRIRVGLKLAQVYANSGQAEQAQAELKLLRDSYPLDAGRFGVADSLVPTDVPTPNAATPASPPQEQGPLPDATLLPPRPPKRRGRRVHER
jgi:uncharacterized protein (TIGR03790 family)